MKIFVKDGKLFIKKSLFFIAWSIFCLIMIVGIIIAFLPVHPYAKPHANKPHITKPTITPAILLQKPPEKNMTSVIDQPVTTTGCGTPVNIKKRTASDINVKVGNIVRSYRIYLPINYENATPHAIVLNFHGYDADAYDEERITQFDPVADNNNFIVVYPNGTLDKAGFSGWNTGLHPGIATNDVLFISNLLNQIQSNFCIDPQRIYATGFSNGGGFVNLLACKMSNRIAAFAPVSGSYVTPFKICNIKRPVPIIEFHGTADETVPYNGNVLTKELSVLTWIGDWIKKDSCLQKPTIIYQTSRVIGYSWPNCKSQASVIEYKIISGKHTWPDVTFKQVSQGHTSYVSPSTIIWNFFQQHPL